MATAAAVVRPADPHRDAEACVAIYAPHVAEAGTFEEVVPDAAAMASRMRAAHVFLVAERGGRLAGYAYGGAHRERPAYRWSTEVSVYVGASELRTGVGRALYVPLLAELRRRRFRMALAWITLPNRASVGLHEALGFELVGVYRNVGYKAGGWRDVGWWQLDLGAPTGEPPLPPER